MNKKIKIGVICIFLIIDVSLYAQENCFQKQTVAVKQPFDVDLPTTHKDYQRIEHYLSAIYPVMENIFISYQQEYDFKLIKSNGKMLR